MELTFSEISFDSPEKRCNSLQSEINKIETQPYSLNRENHKNCAVAEPLSLSRSVVHLQPL